MLTFNFAPHAVRSVAAAFLFFSPPGDGSTGVIPPPPPPPPPPATSPNQGFDAGPGFGRWFNLAYRAGSSSPRRQKRTGIGAEIEALLEADAPEAETPQQIVERAVERIVEARPLSEVHAFSVVEAEERRYRAALNLEARSVAEARQAFADEIAAYAAAELARQKRERRRRDDDDMIAVLAATW